MNIILQNYNDLLKNVIFETINNSFKEELNKFDTSGNVFNYINILSSLDEGLCIVGRNLLTNLFINLDETYRKSIERKRKYDIKAYHTRSIMTIFGEITFKRTFYVSKINNRSYCYLDRLLGLHKYDYFDPYLKTLIINYVADNSFSKTASYINDLLGNRIKITENIEYVSRQTVRNIVMAAILSKPEINKLEDKETIYIMADEKYIHTQNNNKKDVMNKAVVVLDGKTKESKNRYKLNNKTIFMGLNQKAIDDSIDYIYKAYNVEKIKRIYVMGDGALWIKNLKQTYNFSKDIEVIRVLDKFHLKQALRHIMPSESVVEALLEYVLENNKLEFKRLANEVIDVYPHRKKVVDEKIKYILNNWKEIITLYESNLSCPMESQISHNIAALFTSRPKGYSIKMIDKLNEIRMLYKNGFNIKNLYLNNFNDHNKLEINKVSYNCELYNRKNTYSLLSKKIRVRYGLN